MLEYMNWGLRRVRRTAWLLSRDDTRSDTVRYLAGEVCWGLALASHRVARTATRRLPGRVSPLQHAAAQEVS